MNSRFSLLSLSSIICWLTLLLSIGWLGCSGFVRNNMKKDGIIEIEVVGTNPECPKELELGQPGRVRFAYQKSAWKNLRFCDPLSKNLAW